MAGIITFLILIIILLIITIHGFCKDELYFDTVYWEVRQKEDLTQNTVNPLENYEGGIK